MIILIFLGVFIVSCENNNSKSGSSISNFFDNTNSLEELTVNDKKFTQITITEEKVVCYLKNESKNLTDEILRKFIVDANKILAKRLYVPSSFVPIDYYIYEQIDIYKPEPEFNNVNGYNKSSFDYIIEVSYSGTGRDGKKWFEKYSCFADSKDLIVYYNGIVQ